MHFIWMQNMEESMSKYAAYKQLYC